MVSFVKNKTIEAACFRFHAIFTENKNKRRPICFCCLSSGAHTRIIFVLVLVKNKTNRFAGMYLYFKNVQIFYTIYVYNARRAYLIIIFMYSKTTVRNKKSRRQIYAKKNIEKQKQHRIVGNIFIN